MPQFTESVSSDVSRWQVQNKVFFLFLIYFKCNFPFGGNTLIKPKDGDVVLILCHISSTAISKTLKASALSS